MTVKDTPEVTPRTGGGKIDSYRIGRCETSSKYLTPALLGRQRERHPGVRYDLATLKMREIMRNVAR